jgi:hypothetical protein
VVGAAGVVIRLATMKTNPALSPLDRTVGAWLVTGSHPYLPGRTLHGRVTFERIEHGAFLRMHSKMDDAEIPEGFSIFGTDGDDAACTMLYFDERGVARRYDVTFSKESRTADPAARGLGEVPARARAGTYC